MALLPNFLPNFLKNSETVERAASPAPTDSVFLSFPEVSSYRHLTCIESQQQRQTL